MSEETRRQLAIVIAALARAGVTTFEIDKQTDRTILTVEFPHE